jgi:hypothetical protein
LTDPARELRATFDDDHEWSRSPFPVENFSLAAGFHRKRRSSRLGCSILSKGPRQGRAGNLFALYARSRAVIAEATGKVATRAGRATRLTLGWASAERLDQLLAVEQMHPLVDIKTLNVRLSS